MLVVYSQDFLKHSFAYHPESPERILSIKKVLDENGFAEYIEPARVDEKKLIAAHSKRLIDELKMRSRSCSGTSDNPFAENTFEIAKLSAGAALQAAKHASENAFSLARPPGHHAGRDFFGGFCYLNNIAIAVSNIIKKYGRVLIVDFDVHLGQGTMDIFSGNDAVFYLSFHQDENTIYPWQKYPVRDFTTELVPIMTGTTDKQYLAIFKKVFNKVLHNFEPNLIACSAGFDMFYRDAPYVGTALRIKEISTFKKIGLIIANSKIPRFAVLEGGYEPESLGMRVYNFLEGWQK